MGNIGGVRKRGLTLAKVETAMREVLDEKFPGIFTVIGPSVDFEGISLQINDRRKDDLEYVLCWWDECEFYPGLIGGKHPRMGQFGYWLLSVIEYGIAAKLKTRIYDEGIGYYRKEDVEKGAGTFKEFITMTSGKSWFLIEHIERKQLPPSLLPWFDGERE